jgi:hypothetical protein
MTLTEQLVTQRNIKANYWQNFKVIWLNVKLALQLDIGISLDLVSGVFIQRIF